MLIRPTMGTDTWERLYRELRAGLDHRDRLPLGLHGLGLPGRQRSGGLLQSQDPREPVPDAGPNHGPWRRVRPAAAVRRQVSEGLEQPPARLPFCCTTLLAPIETPAERGRGGVQQNGRTLADGARVERHEAEAPRRGVDVLPFPAGRPDEVSPRPYSCSPWLTAHVGNPSCSCKPTRVRPTSRLDGLWTSGGGEMFNLVSSADRTGTTQPPASVLPFCCALLSPCSRRFNRDGEGVSAE